jgi:histidine triad (HIT) family protein
MASIFTKIIQGEIPSYKIAETEHYYAFLDIRPLTKGHTLVIPKIEIDYIFDLDNEVLSGLMLFAKKVAAALEKTVSCKRVGLMVLGMEVPHAHVHLIPINKEGDMSLANSPIQLSQEEMADLASAVRANYTD